MWGDNMTVVFYTVTDANNVVNKTLPSDSEKTMNNVDVFRPSSVENPQIICDNFANVADKNYCYIAKYNRYYFITGITFLSAQRCMINCSVDVLKTYANDINNSTGVFLRSENPISNYMNDSKFPLNGKVNVYSWLFPQTPFTNTSTSSALENTISLTGLFSQPS